MIASNLCIPTERSCFSVGRLDHPGVGLEAILAMATERGVSRIIIGHEATHYRKWVEGIKKKPSPGMRDIKIEEGGAIILELFTELKAYFRGELQDFQVPLDYHDQGTPFQREVWDSLRTIPYGETRSYVELARSIHRPTAARAIGQANGKNPLPVVIPCHRVIAADGSLGGFTGGISIKKVLLGIEGASWEEKYGT